MKVDYNENGSVENNCFENGWNKNVYINNNWFENDRIASYLWGERLERMTGTRLIWLVIIGLRMTEMRKSRIEWEGLDKNNGFKSDCMVWELSVGEGLDKNNGFKNNWIESFCYWEMPVNENDWIVISGLKMTRMRLYGIEREGLDFK